MERNYVTVTLCICGLMRQSWGGQTMVAVWSGERRHIAVALDRIPLLNAHAAVHAHRRVTPRRRLCAHKRQRRQTATVPAARGRTATAAQTD